MRRSLKNSFVRGCRALTLVCLCVFFCHHSNSQPISQNIRGYVINKLSRQPVMGAYIRVNGSEKGAVSDSTRHFLISGVPVGRHAITCTVMGYALFSSEEFILSSGRETTFNVELTEKPVELRAVRIAGVRDESRAGNAYAFVSARSFTPEETERVPASINDPGRMVVAYPGVKPGRDESENKILVRGNSPFGVLWRLEGIDIPSPNHFAMPGAGGAGVSVFSAQLLSRSDFFTGGMPAEYGNSISGAFDIRFREGNQQKREYRVKAGLVGLDLSAEGPLKNGRSSYLVNYRYSTLGLLSQIGFYLAGERTINYFQDLSFNLAFHSKNGKQLTTVFGIGGLSNEHHLPVESPEHRVPGKSEQWEDRLKPANMGAIGLTHTTGINSRSSLKYVVALIGSNIQRKSDTLNLENIRFRYDTQRYKESRIAASVVYNNKLSDRSQFRTGAILNFIQFDFKKTIVLRRSLSDINSLLPQTSVDGNGNTQTAQAYASFIQALGSRLSLQTGVHFMHLFLNHSSSFQPRISLRYQLPNEHVLSFAYGLYSQLLPMSAYFYTRKDTLAGIVSESRPNAHLSFPRSTHLILSYRFITSNHWKVSAEAYYQFISKVPVEINAGSPYYMLNQSDGFPETASVSRGSGRNGGIDVGIEKFFFRKYYLLISASVFDSRYRTLTVGYMPTAFNDKFSTAVTFGKEFTFKNGAVLQVGAKSLYNGGFPYTAADVEKSAAAHQYIPLQTAYYAINAPDYFRIDGRVSFRTNHKRYASVLSLDMQNVTNRINVTSVQYNSISNALEPRKTGSGIVPVLSYQVDF